MVIAGLIKSYRPFLYAFGCYIESDMDASVSFRLCRHYTQFDSVECPSRISSGHIGQKNHCIFINICVVCAHALVGIIYGTLDQHFDILCAERLKLKYHRSG